MVFPCKQPLCPGLVKIDKDDSVIGNFSFQQLADKNFKIKAQHAIPIGKTVGVLKITQPEHAEIREQAVMFQRNELQKIEQKDRFYLTCDQGHTLVYEINIEDE